MAELKNGNFDCAAILFERYHISIYNYFYRMTYFRDESHDLSQNTFHRMLKYRQSFNAEKSFKSWLFGIARNEFLAFSENKKISFKDIDEEFLLTDSSEIQREMSENIEVLNLAMNKLSFEERELIVMHRFQEMKQSEIAEILNISLSAIKVRMHRTMLKLRKNYFMLNESTILK